MQLYSQGKSYKLYEGSMLDMLEVLEPSSIDSVITDPPYELNFMRKGWDNSGIVFQTDTWVKCNTVLKPGGYLLVFGSPKTYHRTACAIEDAGFIIQDITMWLYGTSMPKSWNIGLALDKKNGVDNRTNTDDEDVNSYYIERQAQNEWSGWGTTLKPAYEPIIIARKPCEGANETNIYYDMSTASRYYYCPKVSNRDRDEGLEKFESVRDPSKGNGLGRVCEFCGAPQLKPELCHCAIKSWVLPAKKNIHPTVKPCKLMQDLVRLVTPNGGTVLDPFNGSGSTGKAVMYENKENDSKYKYIGIELTHDYLPISDARISYAANMLRQYRLF